MVIFHSYVSLPEGIFSGTCGELQLANSKAFEMEESFIDGDVVMWWHVRDQQPWKGEEAPPFQIPSGNDYYMAIETMAQSK